ncbi:Ribose-phosphate pyrophosphokinase [Alteracholeplasma palmae J233]|uniref:Ribose-phosphate pyrophosphokinase n=1 Tax=Alteracholeplasma palmae (strain ATCC 49389 / J233) TaxID=1318466 RepID=U4KJK5_ALTPJ|nr:ribose-phosphate pyrophosphokinase [Alteracholeplasma palmae]CCV63674.1 Ribose-phosphate pyrophosphokinase [Alteracholeplasma palmae J233]
MVIDGKKIKLFALSANKQLAEKISAKTKIPLSLVDVVKFADGEMTMNINESVRGQHVFIIQPTSAPANDHLMEVLILADALKRASAASIAVIMPYFGYSRQDRKSRSRQPITAKLIADLLQVSGVNRVACMDLHAAQIQGFFDIPIDNFPAAPLLAAYFKKKDLKDVVVVSPDHGGVSRARIFAQYLGAPIAIIDKRRPEPNKAQVMNIVGDVKGQTAIMIDDIIDTAGTLTVGAQALLDAGAKEVYAAATHPVFSGEALERIKNSCLKEVVVTDTIALGTKEMPEKIVQLSVGSLLGEAILHIINDEPISEIFTRVENLI